MTRYLFDYILVNLSDVAREKSKLTNRCTFSRLYR